MLDILLDSPTEIVTDLTEIWNPSKRTEISIDIPDVGAFDGNEEGALEGAVCYNS